MKEIARLRPSRHPRFWGVSLCRDHHFGTSTILLSRTVVRAAEECNSSASPGTGPSADLGPRGPRSAIHIRTRTLRSLSAFAGQFDQPQRSTIAALQRLRLLQRHAVRGIAAACASIDPRRSRE